MSEIPVIALVGYTNAGKSTLLNYLSNSDVYVADKLFATLDPTTRRINLPDGKTALFTDTVGFIQKLPTTLVAAFRATLEEITEADLLLHIIDIVHVNALSQAESVLNTLKEIEADHIPILTVLNKIDRLSNPEYARQILSGFDNAVAISALKGEGMADLLFEVENNLFEPNTLITVQIPYKDGNLVSQFHEFGNVDLIEYLQDGILIAGKIPDRLFNIFQPFIVVNPISGLNNENANIQQF